MAQERASPQTVELATALGENFWTHVESGFQDKVTVETRLNKVKLDQNLWFDALKKPSTSDTLVQNKRKSWFILFQMVMIHVIFRGTKLTSFK